MAQPHQKQHSLEVTVVARVHRGRPAQCCHSMVSTQLSTWLCFPLAPAARHCHLHPKSQLPRGDTSHPTAHSAECIPSAALLRQQDRVSLPLVTPTRCSPSGKAPARCTHPPKGTRVHLKGGNAGMVSNKKRLCPLCKEHTSAPWDVC